ncbi:putative double-stranded RNA-binding domain protein [Vibrio phage 496E54-1]|nr:putative double-stranded RNA-binding domain protein [Vibrio phage 496E54-1]
MSNIEVEDIVVSVVEADHEKNLGQWSMQKYSGIVLYHTPTGTQVESTKHKSQWKNKAEAISLLETKVSSESSKVDHILKLIADLKVSLGSYENLTLEDYDILHGDVENIQFKVFELLEK